MTNNDPMKWGEYYDMNIIVFLNVVSFTRDRGRYAEEIKPKT